MDKLGQIQRIGIFWLEVWPVAPPKSATSRTRRWLILIKASPVVFRLLATGVKTLGQNQAKSFHPPFILKHSRNHGSIRGFAQIRIWDHDFFWVVESERGMGLSSQCATLHHAAS